MATPVIFKKEQGVMGVVAFFPTIPGTSGWDVTCYAHIGQHASASLEYMRKCRPAKSEEYADLLRELKAIGYDDLRVVRRMSKTMSRERMQEACR